jgi:hypothetical protein
LITIQLTKLESALDQVRKTHTKLMPTDAALVATALTQAGHQAIALYEEQQYVWPEDVEKLSSAMLPHIRITQEAIEAAAPKRVSKSAPEEEPISLNVGLMPNISAGERVLAGRDDLKTVLSDVLADGVEYAYNPTDLGWQWALDRVNWSTVAGSDISRRIRIKTAFTQGAVGVELGSNAPKKRASKKVEVEAIPIPAEVPAEIAEFADAE